MVKSRELKLLRKKLKKAEQVESVLGDTVRLDNDALSLSYQTRLDETELADCLSIFEGNMGDLYRHSSWGLDMEEKRSEFTHKSARFLIVKEGGSSELAAFVHFRVCLDDDEEPEAVVVYVYEVQIASSHQRQGLGKKLMEITETICRNVGLDKVMLTVFNKNKSALKFYERIDYIVDDTSPSQHGESEDYEILSKSII